MIESYRGRRVSAGEPVWVYRNLMREGVWYSLMQRNLVVAHADAVALGQCEFRVRQGGRARVLKDGVKNVHAFVVGYLLNEDATVDLPLRARYNPREAPYFRVLGIGAQAGFEYQLHQAKHARLNAHGLTVRDPTLTSEVCALRAQ